ncbi:hypothetical protein [Ekhidna sp.]
MKNINKRILVYFILSLPGILSLFKPYEVAIISYDTFSLVIVSVIVFIFIYLVTKKILNWVSLSLRVVFKPVSIFFVANGALFLLSAIIYGLNLSLGILSLAYGLGVFFGDSSYCNSSS